MTASPKNYKLSVAYDGTRYFGWQKNKGSPTIEGVLEEVLAQALKHPVSLQAASRTDRGVHAMGQIVNFFSPLQAEAVELLVNRLSALLPDDISILTIEQAPPSFHPTLDAIGKEYHYTICNDKAQEPFSRPFSWHIPQKIDCEKMQQAATLLIGKHDFSSFSNTSFPRREKTSCHLQKITLIPLRLNAQQFFIPGMAAVLTNRSDFASPTPGSEKFQQTKSLTLNLLNISLVGDRFLYKMARNLVGTLVYVGLGKLTLSAISEILEKKDRTHAGVTAPACGLLLKKVTYSSK